MDVATRLDYFRNEHEEFLRFLRDWELTLEATASKNLKEVALVLNRLRQLQPRLQAIRNHCVSEERRVDVPYREYLHPHEILRLREEHLALGGMVSDLFAELRFATIYETHRARAIGQEVVNFARTHIEFEKTLLDAIERRLSEEAEQEVLLRYSHAAK